MPPRSSASSLRSSSGFYPPNDPATYRDILLFEERLKSTAAILQERKYRYQIFLLQLLLIIAFLLSEVLAYTAILSYPYTWILRTCFPDIYPRESPHVPLHPYFASGLLFVSVTTLVLFFASGLYSEKIAYANQYVPHANRALRSLNMYLNVRKPPLTSKIPFNPLKFFFPRSPPSPTTSSTNTRARSASPARSPSPSSPTTPQPIPPIPPASNPRGELIFSSRVDRAFREGYERHRANFEKRREERERIERAKKGWVNLLRTMWGGKRGQQQPSSPAGGATVGAGGASPGSSLEGAPSIRLRTPPLAAGASASGSPSVKSRTKVSRNSMLPEWSEGQRTQMRERGSGSG